ncbi:hypothetical protein RYX36_009718 [Vicia faba]
MDDASARNTLQHYTSTELRFKVSRKAHPPYGVHQRHVPLRGQSPLLLVGKRTTGARIASSPDSDLEAFSHNPTHGSEHNGALTLSGAPFQGTWARSAAEDASPDYNSNAEGDRFSCIAFRYVLHRCKSLDIRCRESFYIMCQNTTRTKTVSSAMQRRGFEFWCGGERTSSSASEPKVSRGVEHLKPTICVQTYSRVGLHERIAGRRDKPTGAHQRRTDRPNPRSNYELFNCNNLNIRYWSWNYRGCWHRTCPPMDPR